MIDWLELRWRRLVGTFAADRLGQRVEDEIQSHVALDVDAQIAAGVSAGVAVRNARLRLGGTTQFAERCRDERQLAWLREFAKDVGLACRQLAVNPGFALAAAVTLGLGIGAASAHAAWAESSCAAHG